MSRLDELRALRDQITREINALEQRYGRRVSANNDVRRVLERAAWRHGVAVDDILSPARFRAATRARQEAAWELRQLNLSYPQIGAILGRDHSTILLAVRKVDAERTPQATAAPVDNALPTQRRARNNEPSPRGVAPPAAGSDRQPAISGRG